MKKIIKSELVAIATVIALISIFFIPIFLPGRVLVTTGLIQSDLMNLNYPIKDFYKQSLTQGTFPLWVPYIATGFPLVAEGQVGAFYPFNIILFFLLPVLQAFTLSMWLNLCLAGIFTYLFVRWGIGLTKTAAIIAGVSYGLSGFSIVHLMHINLLQATIWVPLQFLFLEMIVKRKKTGLCFIALTATLAMQMLAGHPEQLFFNLFIVGVYLCSRIFFSKEGQKLKSYYPVLLFAIGGIIAAGIAAVQLLPTLELTTVSNRSAGITYEEATSYLFPLSHLLTLVFPWAFDIIRGTVSTPGSADITNLWETYSYIGLIPFALVVVGIKYWKKNYYAQTFLIMAIFTLLISLGRTTPVFHIIWSLIPGMQLLRYPTRFVVFFQFALVILAAFGWQYVQKELLTKIVKTKTRKIITVSIVILMTFDLVFTQWRIHKTTDAKTWFEPPTTAKFLQNNAGLYRYYPLSTSSIDYASVEDIELQKEVRELMPPDFNMIYKVSVTASGSHPFVPGVFMQVNKAVDRKMNYDEINKAMIITDQFINLLSMQGVKYVVGALKFENPALTLVKTVNLPKEITHVIPITRGGEVDIKRPKSNTVYIYENTKVLKRAFVVPTAIKADENWTNIDFNNPNFDSTVYLKDFNEKIENNPDFQGNATIMEYENMKVTVKTTSNKKSFLFLSDSFYPGWKAYINGQEAKIYQANIAYRGVMVPAGESTVEFKYTSDSFKKGLIITLISVTLFIVGSTLLIFVSHRKKRLA